MAACGMRCAAAQSPGYCSFWCFTPRAEESSLFSPSPMDGGGRAFSSKEAADKFAAELKPFFLVPLRGQARGDFQCRSRHPRSRGGKLAPAVPYRPDEQSSDVPLQP